MVRTFPRITRRPRNRRTAQPVAVTLVACSLLLGVGVAPLATADDLKDKKAKVDRQVHGANEDLEHSSAALLEATAELGRAQGQLDVAQAKLARTQGELAAAEALDRKMQAELDVAIAELAQARLDLEEGHAKVADQEHQLGAIVVSNYQSGDPALMGLSMVLTSQDPAELTGQLNSVQNVIDKEAVTLSRLEASRVLLTVQEQQVEEAKVEVARKRRAAAENLLVKQELERRAVAEEQQVQNLVTLRAEAEDKAEEARQADLRTLQSLEKEQDRITAILKKRAEAARRRAAAAAAAAAGSVGPVHSNGFLNYPVPGAITSPYGMRRHPIYGYVSLHDGVDFRGACGSPIYAPASGRVLQEYYQSAWGNRIIIDHGFQRGVGLASISNHLSGYAVPEGAWVERGQIVGYVGTTGWSTGCHVHFSVLENGGTVNPMRWL